MVPLDVTRNFLFPSGYPVENIPLGPVLEHTCKGGNEDLWAVKFPA